ncbi:4-hydroxy-tetrahydrodipicolinate reductase [Clostridiales bacterium COT073_COT-073]|nr:4-hydroxy-tetrahydrodipicolinate reductase [Clostridiales bacterium COT073_COT-073]
MTKIILHGCFGKMGQAITEIVKDMEDVQIVAGIDPHAGSADYPVFPSLAECAIEADVVVDFSAPAAVVSLLEAAVPRKIPVVVCTTGLSKEQINLVKESAGSIPLLFSANMSLGINLMISLVKKAALVLTEAGFDIEIIEKHHNRKKDAPSGTALYLADAINSVFDYDFAYSYGRSHQTEPREKNEIGISSLRGGNIAGEHQVIFAGEDEILEIHHKAGSRRIFAVGAIGAARFLSGKTAGLYTMSDVIG